MSSTASRWSRSAASTCRQKPEPLPARRGISIPARLDAVVLSCLEKDPEHRPQTVDELRRRLEACRIEPWDRTDVDAWWRAHPADPAVDVALSTSEAKTIAVDGVHR